MAWWSFALLRGKEEDSKDSFICNIKVQYSLRSLPYNSVEPKLTCAVSLQSAGSVSAQGQGLPSLCSIAASF